MKKIGLFFMLILLMLVRLDSQSTEDVIKNLEGQLDAFNEITENASIAESTAIGLAFIPAIIYPIAVWADLDNQTRADLELSSQVLSAISIVTWITTFAVKTAYQKKSKDMVRQLYEYKKILSTDEYYNLLVSMSGEETYE